MLKSFQYFQRNFLSKTMKYQFSTSTSTLITSTATTPAVVDHPLVSYAEHPYQLTLADGKMTDNLDDRKFAVVQFSGHQYKVTEGDSIIVDKYDAKDIGEELEFENVLLIGSKNSTYVGRPIIPGARVTAVVEEKLKDAKVIIFKKRRRKNSQRKRGFRRDICVLRIGSIEYNHPNK